jgi:hypothetical protein
MDRAACKHWRMRLRVSRWLWWTLAFGLTPLAAAFLVQLLDDGKGPSAEDLLGNGQGLLTAVAWLGATIRELRDAPHERAGMKENLTGSAFVFAVITAIAYGSIATRVANGNLQPATRQLVTWVSVVLLVVAAALSLTSVAVATPKREQEASR